MWHSTDSEHQVTLATQTLLMLQQQASVLQAELRRLRQDVSSAQQTLGDTLGAQLLEANTQLVIAALTAQKSADDASQALDAWIRASQRDALTDTPNRTLMRDRLDTAIAQARRRGTHIAVAFLDLDHFKHINDTLGHAAGDTVVCQVARRLESVVRESDTVSRHGGDEFLVLLTDVGDEMAAHLVAEKMLSALARPCHVGEQVLRLSASVGMAIYPGDGLDAAALIGCADAAMYRAKKAGNGGVALH